MSRRMPKELAWLLSLWILWLLFWAYNNLALIISIILFILFVLFLSFWVLKYTESYNIWSNNNKIIWVILIIISLIPFYFLSYIVFNFDDSNKYLQEKSISWITELWKAALMFKKPKTFIVKEVKKEAREELIENSWSVLEK